MPTPKTLLLLLSGIYLILAFGYAVLVPPWESPDEPAHYLYVRQLAGRWRPAQDTGIRQTLSFSKDEAYTRSNYEWYQPALGYLPGALVYKGFSWLSPESLPKDIPHLNPAFSLDPVNNANLFEQSDLRLLHVWRDQWGLLAIRLSGVLLGLGVLWAAFKVGEMLDPGEGYFGLLAAGLIALLPQFDFVSATIRSDTLANVLGALVLLQGAKIVQSRQPVGRAVLWMSLLIGIGLIAKYTFLYMLPLGLLVVALARPDGLKSWLKLTAAVLLPALIIAGVYLLLYPEARHALAYAFGAALPIRSDYLNWDYLRTIPGPLLIDLFFARFGWANIITARPMSQFVFGVWGVGLSLTLIQGWRALRGRQQAKALTTLILLASGLFLAALGVLRFNLAVYQPQGRLLFPALVSWAVLAAWGLWQTLSERGRVLLVVLSLSFLLLFNIYALFGVILPDYY